MCLSETIYFIRGRDTVVLMSEYSTQRMVKRGEKSRSLKLFAITINIYLLYLLFQVRFFLNVGYFFTVITVIFVLVEIMKRRRDRTVFHSNLSSYDIMRMATKYLRINRIFLVATILGLILSTIVISQTSLMSASYEQRAFDDFTENVDTTALQFNGWLNNGGSTTYDNWLEYVPGIESLLNENNLELDTIENELSYRAQLVMSYPVDTGDGSYVDINRVRLVEYTEEMHAFYSNFTPFNYVYNSSESYLVYPRWFDTEAQFMEVPFSDLEKYELLLGDSYRQDSDFSLIELDVAGNFSIPDQEREDYLREHGWEGWEYFDLGLLLSTDQFDEVIKAYNDYATTNNDAWSGLDTSFTTQVKLVLPSLADTDIDTLITQLDRLERKIWIWLSEFQSDGWIDYYSPLTWALQNYKFEVQGMNAVLFFITAPLLALALFLVYFSLSLVEARKQRLMAILKMRGSSREQLRILLVEEVMVTGILAIIVGMILSVPWASISLQEAGLLSSAIDLSTVIIPADWYWKLPLIGMIFALDLNLPNINKLIKTTVDEGDIHEEKKQPFWQRYYLDLGLFGLSVIYWIGVRFINTTDFSIFSFIVIFLSPFMLLIFFIGAPLVTARYFSGIIGWFSEFIWNKQGGMIALATRNMKKNKFSASRLSAFLLMGIMLSYMAVIVPASFEHWNNDRVNYGMGADIVISGLDSSNQTAYNLINQTDVAAYTEVIKSYVLTKSNNLHSVAILGIDPLTFADVAYWQDYYADESLEDLVSHIVDNDTILMQEGILRLTGLSLEQDFFINLDVGESSQIYSPKIVDTFTYFPNLVDRLPYEDTDGYVYSSEGYIVSDIIAAKTIGSHQQQVRASTYVRINEGANITQVTEELAALYQYNSSISVTSTEGGLIEMREDPVMSIIFSALRSMLVITIIASIIAVSYFSFITLAERKKEIGVFRAMGMIKNQIFMLLLFEGLTLLLVSMIFGGIAGYVSSSNIFFFFQQIFGAGGTNAAPPVFLHIPWDKIGSFTGTIFILTVISAAIPAQLTASKQTGSILRAE